jgi:hypothetical protein
MSEKDTSEFHRELKQSGFGYSDEFLYNMIVGLQGQLDELWEQLDR